jgi:hypothetical protein
MNNFKKMLKYGRDLELEVLPIIRNAFESNDIKMPKNKYSSYNYIDDKKEVLYELKARTNKYNAYPTTMIQEDKVLNTHYKQIFLFKFTDGLYYIEYDPELFNTFEKKIYSQYRADKVDVNKLYYYIPIEHLKRVLIKELIYY